MQKLIPWITDFSNIEFPSVGLFIESSDGDMDHIFVVVGQSIDHYPKYLINFGRVAAHILMEESYSPLRGYETLLSNTQKSNSYLWHMSPWAVEYDKGAHFVGGGSGHEFKHYVIIGGDNCAEIITQNEPTVTMVTKPFTYNIQYKV